MRHCLSLLPLSLALVTGCGGGGSGGGSEEEGSDSPYDLQVSIEDLGSGDYQVTFKNAGSEDIVPLFVSRFQVFDGSGAELSDLYGSLTSPFVAGSEKVLDFTYDEVGSVKVVADFYKDIDESNESNNTATADLVDPKPSVKLDN